MNEDCEFQLTHFYAKDISTVLEFVRTIVLDYFAIYSPNPL